MKGRRSRWPADLWDWLGIGSCVVLVPNFVAAGITLVDLGTLTRACYFASGAITLIGLGSAIMGAVLGRFVSIGMVLAHLLCYVLTPNVSFANLPLS